MESGSSLSTKRVDETLKLTDGIECRHCPGEDNPADLDTRGITPSRCVSYGGMDPYG